MIKTVLFFKRFFLPTVIVFLFTSFSMAAAPLYINYQGKLTNSSGVPIGDSVSVRFRFYNHSTQSNPENILGSSESIPVTPVNGVFSVPIPVQASWFSGTEVYLGVSVDGGAEMAPRQKLVASPYALAVGANSVGTNEIANYAVTSDKLAPTFKINANQIDDNGTLPLHVIASSVAVDAVTTAQIKNGSITSDKLNSSFKINAEQINDNGSLPPNVIASSVAVNAVTTAQIADEAITSAKLNPSFKINADQINDNGTLPPHVIASSVAVNAVTTAQIEDGAVDTNDLHGGAVTKSKLLSSDFIDVYKTKGDNRLVLDGDYKSAACKGVGPSDDFYDCDGNCNKSIPESCSASSNATKVGRLLVLP